MSPSGLPTLEEFYDAVPARRSSGEVDFGVMWRSGLSHWPQYRVSWIAATGEVYAVALASGLNAGVVVLGKAPDRAAVDRALEGWTDQCGEPNGLLWIREALLEASVR